MKWGIIALLFGALALVATACEGSGLSSGAGNADLEEAPASAFSLGEEFGRFSLSAVLLPPDTSSEASFIYGECVVPLGTDGGCAPPLEVQNWKLCERPPGMPLEQLDKRRGVPSAWRGGGLELYTGETTIVISGIRRLKLSAVNALRQGADEHPARTLDPPRLAQCARA